MNAVVRMGWSDVPTPVFIDTNLGTRFAAPLSPHITAMDFKRELEGMHLNCFPEFGSIKVNALMVKQRSHFYHLSESLPLEYAFKGLNETRFLKMDVDLRSSPVHKKRWKHSREKRKRKKERKYETGRPEHRLEELNWTNKPDENVIIEDLSITYSEPASVSGIIKKYFSDYDEVASSKSMLKSRIECKRSNIQSPQESSREKHIKPEVGNRLLLASEGLGLSPSNRRPILSLCRYNVGNSLFHESTATVGNLVFEMTEESE